jgi:RNAse (barnase) inhibitor barstar
MKTTQVITLDASDWQDVVAFYDAACVAVGAPHWHGRNLNAFVDSMVYGGINAIEAPYTLRFVGLSNASDAVRSGVSEFIAVINDAQGSDTGIVFEQCD